MNKMTEDIRIDRCVQCGEFFVSPAYVCPSCGGETFESDVIPGKGKIYTHTTIRIAPEAFRDQAPYPMAVVELPHGLRLTARILLKKGEKPEIERNVRCVRQNETGCWFELE